MLKIRLRRMGKRHRPFYRVVVSDSRSVPSAPAVDEIGHYDPMAQPPRVRIDLERVEHWTDRGARLTPSVKKLVKGARTGKFVEPAAGEKAAQEAKKARAAEPAAPPAASDEELRAAAEKEETPTAAATDEARDAQAAGTEAAAKVKAADEAREEEKGGAAAEAEEPAAEAEAAAETEET